MIPAALLSGCGTFVDPGSWLEDESEPVAELVDLSNRVQPRQLWSRDVGGGTDSRLLGLAPLPMGGVVYAASADGQVNAFDAATGQARWSVDLEVPISGGPGGGDGLVLVGTSDGELIALSAADGQIRWRTSLSSEILSAPAAHNGVAVAKTGDGKLFGLEATNGAVRWRYERDVPVLTLRGSGSPVIAGGGVFAGLSGGKLVALRLDNGDLIWEAPITVPTGRSELERLADIDGDPIVAGGGVFVGTFQGEVAAVEQRSGRVAWRRQLSSHSGMGFDRQRLYVADAEGVVWALDPRSGSAIWSQDALLRRNLSNVTVLGDLLVVGDFEGYLHWINSANGELMARTRVGSAPITGGLKVVDEVLYVQGDAGDLAAVRLPGDD